jgi:hypothetical protein
MGVFLLMDVVKLIQNYHIVRISMSKRCTSSFAYYSLRLQGDKFFGSLIRFSSVPFKATEGTYLTVLAA